jgi:hypothetical protein
LFDGIDVRPGWGMIFQNSWTRFWGTGHLSWFWTIAVWNSLGWVFGQNGPKQPHLDQLGTIHAQ